MHVVSAFKSGRTENQLASLSLVAAMLGKFLVMRQLPAKFDTILPDGLGAQVERVLAYVTISI